MRDECMFDSRGRPPFRMRVHTCSRGGESGSLGSWPFLCRGGLSLARTTLDFRCFFAFFGRCGDCPRPRLVRGDGGDDDGFDFSLDDGGLGICDFNLCCSCSCFCCCFMPFRRSAGGSIELGFPFFCDAAVVPAFFASLVRFDFRRAFCDCGCSIIRFATICAFDSISFLVGRMLPSTSSTEAVIDFFGTSVSLSSTFCNAISGSSILGGRKCCTIFLSADSNVTSTSFACGMDSCSRSRLLSSMSSSSPSSWRSVYASFAARALEKRSTTSAKNNRLSNCDFAFDFDGSFKTASIRSACFATHCRSLMGMNSSPDSKTAFRSSSTCLPPTSHLTTPSRRSMRSDGRGMVFLGGLGCFFFLFFVFCSGSLISGMPNSSRRRFSLMSSIALV
mmetsp:Transcript_13310/g.38335  ORF Transcript_13310/g.38335 Transcript_13310/m.38335 type:complete len:391 (-) Transcript_13310:1515-2687(-)